MAPTTTPEAHAFAGWDPRQARGRLLLALAVGAVSASGVPPELGWTGRFVAGWDAGAIVMLALSWWIIARADADETKRRASAEDPGRSVMWGIALLASAVSLFAATVGMHRAKTLSPDLGGSLVAMCFVAVAAAWGVTHTAYTLRYAHLYYRDDAEGEGGLVFPCDDKPRDMDFAYFAFTIGMCFQVSDVTIQSPLIRRGVLGHSMLSFAYNTAVVALTLNLVFSYVG